MNDTLRFEVTEEHLKLMRRMYVGWQDCEYGAPEIDPKRPYGNSDVEGDIAEILGWTTFATDESWRDRAATLHREMQTVLQIVLAIGRIATGSYEKTERYRFDSWREALAKEASA